MERDRLIVDRIENGLAVCECDGAIIEIPLAIISGSVREGDILGQEGEGCYLVAQEETALRKEAIQSRFNALKAKKE